MRVATETLKIALFSVAMLAGCSADLFNTPLELRGLWQTESDGRILDIRERSFAVYRDTGRACSLVVREDFAGPRLSEWETVLDGDGEGFRFREPGSLETVSAMRIDALPARCVFPGTNNQ